MSKEFQIDTAPGAITRVPGFRASGVACGIKQAGGPDLALVLSDRPATTAALFTTNAFKAAPVLYDLDLLSHSHYSIQAVLINSGNANACTGAQGLRDARRMARLAESALDLPAGSVFVMSTGIIGVPLPMPQIEAGVQAAVEALSKTGGADAARAILTTDLVPKQAFLQVQIGSKRVSIAGIAKGSGMIHPDLAPAGQPHGTTPHRNIPYGTSPHGNTPHATMLAAIVTDAAISPGALDAALAQAVELSFNRVTVDGDTSTNDTVVVMASGAAGNPPLELDSDDYATFQGALAALCTELARAIARDGEGATRLVEIRVRGAVSDAQAAQAAKTVATSPLVKAAIFGADPNWGRVLAAIGRSRVQVDPARVDLWLGGLQLVASGEPLPFDAQAARRALGGSEVRLVADLGLGPGQATVWTCDLSYKYVEINAEYHT